MTKAITKTAAEALTVKVASMSAPERSARIQEIVHTPGQMRPEACLEFAKLLFGPHVSVDFSGVTTSQKPVPARRLLYTKKEACSQLSISLRNLDRRIAEGTVKTRHLGGRVLIPHAELVRLSRGDQPPVRGK
jgi:hypothetical protein